MKKLLPVLMFGGGMALFALAFFFFQQSNSLKRETDTLRDIVAGAIVVEGNLQLTGELEPEFDLSDLDQSPPGVEPFIGSTACVAHWGLQVRQYCAQGDDAILDTAEGGYDAAENMRTLTMCLNEAVQRTDAYGTDYRHIDSEIPLTEESRKILACNLTRLYGSSPVFDRSDVYYIIKEHVEVGNIERLESR